MATVTPTIDIYRSTELELWLTTTSEYLDQFLPMAPSTDSPASPPSSSIDASSRQSTEHACPRRLSRPPSRSPSPPLPLSSSDVGKESPSSKPPMQLSTSSQQYVQLTFSQQLAILLSLPENTSPLYDAPDSPTPEPISPPLAPSSPRSSSDQLLPPIDCLDITDPLPSFIHFNQPETLRVFTDSPMEIVPTSTRPCPTQTQAPTRTLTTAQVHPHAHAHAHSHHSHAHTHSHIGPTLSFISPPTRLLLRAKPRGMAPPAPMPQRQRGRPTDHSGDFQRSVQTLIYKHNANAQWHQFRKQRKCTVARAPCVKGYMKFCEYMGGEFTKLRTSMQYRNLGSRTECQCPY